jgi:oligopeptidase B
MNAEIKMTPPTAEREPHTLPMHGAELHDDYAWMRDKSSPRVLSYLQAENAYTDAYTAGTKELQQQLYDEILSHIKEDDVSVPYREGDFEYLTRTEKGSQYGRYSRYPAGQPEGETVILDVNQLAQGKPFLSLGALAISPDGRLLAYTTDTTGFRQYTLHVRDLTSGPDYVELADTAERVGSIVWAGDSSTLFFTTEDEQTKRQDRLFRMTLGSAAVEVFHEEDERFNLGVGRTRDRRFLVMEAGSHTTSEAWILESETAASTPTARFRRFAERIDEEKYGIDHRDGYFYILTNRDAERFRLMRSASRLVRM